VQRRELQIARVGLCAPLRLQFLCQGTVRDVAAAAVGAGTAS
jgi:hypothetical protein